MVISIHQEDERIEGVHLKRSYLDMGNFFFYNIFILQFYYLKLSIILKNKKKIIIFC